MSWSQRLLNLIPRPFKYMQRKLDIEQEWSAFKANLRPHRYKIIILFGVVSYPLYRETLFDLGKKATKTVSEYFREQTEPNQPAFQWLENLYI